MKNGQSENRHVNKTPASSVNTGFNGKKYKKGTTRHLEVKIGW
jgi:hypothetical protein